MEASAEGRCLRERDLGRSPLRAAFPPRPTCALVVTSTWRPPPPSTVPRLIRAREAAGLTQHQLARVVGVAGGERISAWEHGRSRPRTPDLLRRVADALGVSPQDLLVTPDAPSLRWMRFAAGLERGRRGRRRPRLRGHLQAVGSGRGAPGCRAQDRRVPGGGAGSRRRRCRRGAQGPLGQPVGGRRRSPLGVADVVNPVESPRAGVPSVSRIARVCPGSRPCTTHHRGGARRAGIQGAIRRRVAAGSHQPLYALVIRVAY